NIVSALNGSGTVELKIVPTVNANGVYIQLSTVLGVASSANVFHAFILEDQPGAAGCPTGIDWLSGSNATLGLALASATGTVANPQLAIDNDLNTAATFSTGVQAASLPYFTSILNTNAKSGDSVRVIIDNPNGGLLNIGLLTSFQIQAFNDNTPVGTPIVNDPALLKIQLLPGATNKNIITAAIPGDFNRIQISMGGVADLSSLLGNGTLNIYDISVKVPAPVIDAATQADQYAYVGSTVTLHAATNATGDPIVWFTDSLGTTPVSTINTSASGVQTFYARSSRDGCTDASGVASVKLHISAISNPALPAGNVGQAYSQVVTADIVAPSDLPNTPVYSFTYASHTFNPVVMGSSPISNIANRYAMIDMPSVFSAGPMNLGTADMFASIDLGNGLFYNDVTNTIEGTPTTEGTYNVTFNVTDDANGGISAGQITKTFAIAAALPVHLGDFNVHLDNNKNAVLNWETASEQNTVRFDVMRSSNGTNFTKIKSVEAAGISTTPKSYSYTDNNPGAKSYYRIDIILTNEATSNSKVISISGGRSSGFAINPNPASDKIVITGINSDDIATVSIYDASGRLVQTATNGTINVQALSHGVYFVTVAQKDGTKSNGKFLKK
ncbi:MAG TPA: T9SS type A sorting domain-containing protein, partial [Arachidicoccus sp.]|nr:T9SS type A sorting domain-containing protein [Arachidicoccus sp.]